ncbi:MAG: helicase-associated domain-containing protein [Chloroflexi bacterium]|nr:helicase-associated domain-containing protein [Chloroflexota bacterium]
MNTLTLYLMHAPAERLHEVLEFWGLCGLAEHSRPFSDGLLREMLHRWTIGTVLERLDPRQRAILWKLLDQRQHALLADVLADTLGLSEPQLAESLADLVRGAVVLVEEPAAAVSRRFAFGQGAPPMQRMIHIPIETVQAFRAERLVLQSPDAAGVTLAGLLDRLPAVEIQPLATRWGIPHATTYSRRELASELDDLLRDESAVERRVREGLADGIDLFDWIRTQGGVGSARAARMAFSPSAVRREIDRLSDYLLVQIGYRSGERVLIIPEGIGAGGRRPRPEPPTLQEVSPPQRVLDHGPLLAWDMLLVAAQVLRSPAEIRTTDGGLHKRSAERLTRVLHVPDDPAHGSRFSLLLTLALDLGLIEQHSNRLRHGPTLFDWGKRGLPALAHAVVQSWLATLARAEPTQYDAWLWGVDRPAMRRRLLDRLGAWCRPGQWYTLDSLIDRIRAVDPFIVRTRQDILRREGPSGLESVLSNWDVVDGRLIQSLLYAALVWLGVVAVGQADDGTTAIQVTPFGSRLLGPADAEELRERDGRPLVVQPNFEVLLLAPSAEAICKLGAFADLVRTDRVSSYTITRESVLAGVELGLIADEMIAFLQNGSQKPLPQNVAYSIADWARQHKPLRFSRALIVEVDDPAVLDDLARARGAASPIARRLGPQAAVLAEGVSLRSLAADLRRRGYSPRLPDEDAAPKPVSGRSPRQGAVR